MVVILPEVVVYDFETSGLLVPIQLPESYPWVTIQEEDPPGPIPNPAVKLLLAYGSMGETPCESRYRPGFYSSERRRILCLRFLLLFPFCERRALGARTSVLHVSWERQLLSWHVFYKCLVKPTKAFAHTENTEGTESAERRFALGTSWERRWNVVGAPNWERQLLSWHVFISVL